MLIIYATITNNIEIILTVGLIIEFYFTKEKYMFDNKTILITGGTGSFGKALSKMLVSKYKPKKVIIFSRDELKQFEMQQELFQPCMRYFLGDVRDKERLIQAFNEVDYVVHAAAMKQIPAAEYNPMECIKTNINGAQNVIDAALANGVKKVIALSTDKAANPVNLYGATKLASDKLFIAANNIVGSNQTCFSVARYGNVVGSRGSVFPFFKKLLEQGEKSLPVTDHRMTRFWITLDQGIEFVSNCFKRMQGGEIFVPKLPSANIIDIVRSFGSDLDFHTIGIRPGEKLHEVMCPQDDSHLTIEFEDHFVIKPSISFVKEREYSINLLGEKGKSVDSNFVYDSGTNSHFLKVDEIKKLSEIT